MARNPGLPHYRRIADALIAQLTDEKRPMNRIPSERALAKKYGVARNTARRALEELREHGYVNRIQGSGTHPQATATRNVFVFGYFVSQNSFLRLFNWLNHLVSPKGIRLIVRDIGLYGEHLDEVFRADQVRQGDAVIWGVSSHPDGIQAAKAARRSLPRSLPMICIGDPLGLSIQSRQRFDVVLFDYAGALHQVIARLERRGMPLPIFVDRADVTVAAWQSAQTIFLGELLQRGVANPAQHILHWDESNPRTLKEFLERTENVEGRPFILPYRHGDILNYACQSVGFDFKPTLIEFDGRGGQFPIPIDTRALAETTYDLLLSRLDRPRRPNLEVRVNLPVRW